MSHIDQAVIVVLVVVQVAGQVNVVDPDVLGRLNGDSITVVSEDLADLQVPHNDVGLPVDGQTDARESYILILVSHATDNLFSRGGSTRTAAGLADDGLVRGDLDLGGS